MEVLANGLLWVALPLESGPPSFSIFMKRRLSGSTVVGNPDVVATGTLLYNDLECLPSLIVPF